VGCCYTQRNMKVFLYKILAYLNLNVSSSNQQLIQIC
jgi:hypothetical protein